MKSDHGFTRTVLLPLIRVALLVVAPVTARSQSAVPNGTQPNATLPSATAVLAHFTTAVGGKDAILKHSSLTFHGKLEVPAPGVVLDMLIRLKPGKKFERYMSSDPSLASQEGIYGDLHWWVDANGPALVPADHPESLHRDTDPFYWGWTQPDYFKSMTVTGREQFMGHACYHVHGITKWNEADDYFFDQNSGLLIGYRWQAKQDDGSRIATTMVLAKYKDFDGHLYPTRSTWIQGTDVHVVVVESITYEDLSDSAFPLPDEVRNLIKQKSSS
jgi:hypothetical protein